MNHSFVNFIFKWNIIDPSPTLPQGKGAMPAMADEAFMAPSPLERDGERIVCCNQIIQPISNHIEKKNIIPICYQCLRFRYLRIKSK
jgi:hypothetical protein